ncbi:hypothetical protein BH09VER1_BH09VER1_35460 [soil metagenome]
MVMDLEPLHPIQLERLRAMTPQEKWDIFLGLSRTAREIRRAAYRRKNPGWDEGQVERAVAQEFARAGT